MSVNTTNTTTLLKSEDPAIEPAAATNESFTPKSTSVVGEEIASPFQIHSSVLDSVFSTNLDGKEDAMLDHTPMFDELDFIIDGVNVNSKDDWVALFEKEDEDEDEDEANLTSLARSGAANGPIISLDKCDGGKEVPLDDLMLEALLVEPLPNGLTDETISTATTPVSGSEMASTECTSIAPPAQAATSRVKKRSFKEVEQTQLFTPNPSSTLPTPQLDVKRPATTTPTTPTTNTFTKKAAVDHLGCVSYSKKQRSQSLKPIDLSGIEDLTVLKRAKNTEAARRSRARKMERMSQLEDRVGGLLKENSQLSLEVERLKSLLCSNGISF
ncbi:GCN4 [Candida oxycetoniae]|uniref:GCN4 n=1 Tax=Candida oxycetoniae TaxID=497107 RepID=A0AAI9SUV6_9ASCO|nr:GCN4 [Candida oxycetoniae]KAI3403133.2 GCN4 [Candida oxycetoniae]